MGRKKLIDADEMSASSSNEIESDVSQNNEVDSLLETITKNLTKQFKNNPSMLSSIENSDGFISDIKEWVSTGSSLLDIAISNRPYGGVPVGRITEFWGLESSGKSLITAHILKHTQEKDGVAVLLDTEFALSSQFLNAIGVNLKKLKVYNPEKIEDIFDIIENIITTVRNSNKDRLVTIVVDSIAAATTDVESKDDYGATGYATQKSILLSKALRKITNLIGKERICVVLTNQARTKMGAMTGQYISADSTHTTSGGYAVRFHTSVRVFTQSGGAIKAKNEYGIDEIVGNLINCKVNKNRCGPPQRKASVPVYFASGINDYESWIDTLKNYDVIKLTGTQYTYKSENYDIKFYKKDFPSLLRSDNKLKEEIYLQLCDRLIMVYKQNGSELLDNTSLDESEVE